MTESLHHILDTLRAHQSQLRSYGVDHAAAFGSVARGEAGAGSDVDILIELDDTRPIGLFQYARLKLYIGDLLGGNADVANRTTLKSLALRTNSARRCQCLLEKRQGR